MKTALIGCTGFVGTNLLDSISFSDLFNSQNIAEIQGRTYDRVICCGARAEKWRINQNPSDDWRSISLLMESLREVEARQFILISTIDVYPVVEGVNEDSAIESSSNHPYGRHRYELEKFCLSQFDDCYVVRLPGLIGKGLKKNVIFDLINDNNVEAIQLDSKFQYYHLRRLSEDIETILERRIRLVNLFSEPVSTREIVEQTRPELIKVIKSNDTPVVEYNVISKHGSLWGSHVDYYMSRQEMLDEIVHFIEVSRAP